jgi:RNA polymerase sigma-70 factor (ECF subfamily)
LSDLDWTDCQDCLAGDANACVRLLKRHEEKIGRQMWRFSRDRQTQAELVQEVFVEAYLSLPKYRRTGVPMGNWLACIATRVGYRFWKQEGKRRGQRSLENVDAAAAPAADDATAAAQLLHEILAALPPADRLVLTLMYFEECSVKEVARRAGWTAAGTKMRAMRARGRLRKMIEERQLTEELLGAGHGIA